MNNKVLWGVIIVIIIIVAAFAFASMNNTTEPVVDNTAATTTDEMDHTDMGTTSTNTTSTNVTASTSVNVSTGAEKVFTVTGNTNFRFDPATITVNKGDKVRIVFKNAGGFHDFTLDAFNVKTKQIQGGAQDEVSFTASKAGSFEYYCSVGNHRAMGMKGTLIVK